MAFNAADPRQVRAAEKRAKAALVARHNVILNIMMDPAGRHYIYDRLVASHIFHSSYARNPYDTAFAEGERNVGLQLLGDVMAAAPDQYIHMMREAAEREKANGRDSNTSAGRERDRADDGRDNSGRSDDADGPVVESDYDPIDDGGEAGYQN